MNRLQSLARLARPFQLLLAVLTYTLGLGIAHFLGASLDGSVFFMGVLLVVLVIAAGNLLNDYFRRFTDPLVEGETPAERAALRRLLLLSGTAFLGVAVLLVFTLSWARALNGPALVSLVLLAVLALANAVPPLRLSERGFNELVSALSIAYVTPAVAFLLEWGEPHRLLTIITFPLTLLALSYFLIADFPDYAADVHYGRPTLLVRLTWERAVPLHNVLLVVSFLLYAGAPFLGVPGALVWPALLTVPLAAYQIFMVRNIAGGAKPMWNVLIANGSAIIGLTAYLLTLTFWLH